MNKSKIVATGLAALAALATAVPSFADSFHWSGDVNSGAKISIHRDDVHIDTPKSGSTANVRSDFHGHLHRGIAGVRLVKVRGRGTVEIREQPSPANDFTAVVSIREKNWPGAGHYEFTLVW